MFLALFSFVRVAKRGSCCRLHELHVSKSTTNTASSVSCNNQNYGVDDSDLEDDDYGFTAYNDNVDSEDDFNEMMGLRPREPPHHFISSTPLFP
jgi:hypothetical protein